MGLGVLGCIDGASSLPGFCLSYAGRRGVSVDVRANSVGELLRSLVRRVLSEPVAFFVELGLWMFGLVGSPVVEFVTLVDWCRGLGLFFQQK